MHNFDVPSLNAPPIVYDLYPFPPSIPSIQCQFSYRNPRIVRFKNFSNPLPVQLRLLNLDPRINFVDYHFRSRRVSIIDTPGPLEAWQFFRGGRVPVFCRMVYRYGKLARVNLFQMSFTSTLSRGKRGSSWVKRHTHARTQFKEVTSPPPPSPEGRSCQPGKLITSNCARARTRTSVCEICIIDEQIEHTRFVNSLVVHQFFDYF